MVGTYSNGCIPDVLNNSSDLGTIVLSNPNGADKITMTVTAKSYTGSTTCAAATITDDITVGGQLTDLKGTKTITALPGYPKTGVAKTVEFRYDSLTLTKGSIIGTLPVFGATGKGGYLIEGNKLYVLSGSPQSDGFPNSFSLSTATKQ